LRLCRAYSVQQKQFPYKKKADPSLRSTTACGSSQERNPLLLARPLTDDRQKKIFCVVILNASEESAFMLLSFFCLIFTDTAIAFSDT
jgi:hypothetical protein